MAVGGVGSVARDGRTGPGGCTRNGTVHPDTAVSTAPVDAGSRSAGFDASGISRANSVLVVPLAAHFVGQSYSAWEAFKFSGLLFAAGFVFFFGGIFWSSVLGSEFAAIAVSGVSAFLAFTAQDYLYRWIPSFQFSYFNLNAFLGGYELLNRTTGLLDGWPWPGIVKSVCAAGVLFWSSTAIIERRDF